jgi:hypothetical protein
MYLSTREIVDGMLNFFYNGIITKVKVSMQRERERERFKMLED